jgi:hypothetical protein
MSLVGAAISVACGYYISQTSPQPKFILLIWAVIALGDLVSIANLQGLNYLLTFGVAPALGAWMFYLRKQHAGQRS